MSYDNIDRDPMIYKRNQEKDVGKIIPPDDDQKFKRVMEADETSKQDQSQKKPPSTEDENSTDDSNIQLPTADTFSGLMNPDSEEKSLYDKDSPGVRKVQVSPGSKSSMPRNSLPSTKGSPIMEQEVSLPESEDKVLKPKPSPDNILKISSSNSQEIKNQPQPINPKDINESGSNKNTEVAIIDTQDSNKENESDKSLLRDQPKNLKIKSKIKKTKSPLTIESVGDQKSLKKTNEKKDKNGTQQLKNSNPAGNSSKTQNINSAKMPSARMDAIQQKKDQIKEPMTPEIETSGAKNTSLDRIDATKQIKDKIDESIRSETSNPNIEQLNTKASKPSLFVKSEVDKSRKIKKISQAENTENSSLKEKDNATLDPNKESTKTQDPILFSEATRDNAGVLIPQNVDSNQAVHANQPISSAQLSPQAHELFARMVGVILIQEDRGITSFSMNVNMPGSLFDGTEIKMERYSTAPNSYNIQLVGNPESVALFRDNMVDLQRAFAKGNYNFETNILNPVLSKKKPKTVFKRKKLKE